MTSLTIWTKALADHGRYGYFDVRVFRLSLSLDKFCLSNDHDRNEPHLTWAIRFRCKARVS